MLVRNETHERNRKELRRGVSLACEIESDYWDEAVPHRLLDLSPSGGFVETMFPLAADEELEIVFHPPKTTSLYWLRARVVRTSFGRRCPRFDVPGMGIEYLDLTKGDRAELAQLLVGLPPRAPVTRRKPYRPNAADPRLVVGGRVASIVEQARLEALGELPRVDDFAPIALAPLLY